MEAASEVVGAVLTGGESRRMGRDKARLELAGRTLGARAVETLRAAIRDVVVVSRRRGDHTDLGAPEIADRRPGNGPLGGLDAALDYAAGRPVFVLACDLPRVGPELVVHLLGRARAAFAAEPPHAAVLPTLGGRPQPLCAAYHPDCRPEIERRLAAGELRMLDLVDALGAVRVALKSELSFFRPDLLDNVNDPGAVARLDLEPASRR